MRIHYLFGLLLTLGGLAACDSDDGDFRFPKVMAEAQLYGFDSSGNQDLGRDLGTVTFAQQADGSMFATIELRNIDPNDNDINRGAERDIYRDNATDTVLGATHAVHIHEIPDCSNNNASTAGGHWNPGGAVHGQVGFSEADTHAGDLGNVVVVGTTQSGITQLNVARGVWLIQSLTTERNIVGLPIIVHAGSDDLNLTHASADENPTGNAGSRIACGIIEAL